MKKMKNLNQIIVGILGCTLILASCSDEKTKAEQMSDNFVKYVDSVSSVQKENAIENWNEIESEYEEAKQNANREIDQLDDKMEYEEKINTATAKYEQFKSNVLAEKEKLDYESQKNRVRVALLGSNYVEDDMKFEWINKDNILSVYENFVNTVEKNKDSYSREDWDEIKLIYEAIDSRKNTVENEGLTSSDNMKIAGLKLKFAPMYTVNRMGAKSEENAEAKQ
jgi:23S rRNA pseudoU1915 N3-methylase RlmH